MNHHVTTLEEFSFYYKTRGVVCVV